MNFPTNGATLNDTNDMERICERYKRLYAALIYDVLEHMGYPAQAVSHRLTPLDRDMKLAGPAFTVKGTMSCEKNQELRFKRLGMIKQMRYPWSKYATRVRRFVWPCTGS
jgi:hypothetical protein